MKKFAIPSSSWRERGAIRILANVEHSDNGHVIDPARVEFIRQMSCKDLNDRPGYLDVIVGDQLMVTYNYDVSRKVANGSRGIVLL